MTKLYLLGLVAAWAVVAAWGLIIASNFTRILW